MRVATWNVQHAKTPAGKVRNDLLISDGATFDADIVSVQELDRLARRSHFLNQVRVVSKGLGTTASIYGDTQKLGWLGTEGHALCVRGDILLSRILRYRVHSSNRRLGILATVRLTDGSELSVASTHLDVGGPNNVEQLKELLTEFDKWPGRRLVLGDLNLRTKSARRILEDHGFTVAGGPMTFPSWAPTARIDHIATDGLRIDNVATRQGTVSDHRALIADLS